MLVIDGSQGEGGGQVLRTSLALSLLTGTPFRMENVRAGRAKPGLLRQHLTAVRAAAAVGQARVHGDELGSRELTFEPGEVAPGSHHFSVGTAGSATLVLQTVLPPLLRAGAPSTLTLEGGTHNPMAPPFDFLDKAFLPLLRRMGARVSARLLSHGFYPAGGGRFVVDVEPADRLVPLNLTERGETRRRRARALLSGLPPHIGRRELEVAVHKLGLAEGETAVEEVADAHGPGNAFILEIESEHVTEVFTGFGERGVRAEAVAGKAVDEARAYLATGAAVGAHLADQLILPLAMAGGGSFTTVAPSRHTTTNLEVVKLFLPVDISLEEGEARSWKLRVATR